MGKTSMSLASLLHYILLMPGEIEITKDVRRVKLKRNPKNHGLMNKLEPALEKLNALKIQHLDGRQISFKLI
jgi:hypothetical protein